MAASKFQQLSQLALVDVLAALPMEHVARMARLGNERLCHTAKLKWVTDRMTDVTFEKLFRAHQMGGDFAEKLCSNSTMKRLKGRLSIETFGFDDASDMNGYVELAKQVPGRLHFYLERDPIWVLRPINMSYVFMRAMAGLSNLVYATVTHHESYTFPRMIDSSPAMVFEYAYNPDTEHHFIFYRPALLNKRHIVDVIRTVCGPLDVDEAELDRIRKKVTEHVIHGVPRQGDLLTWWRGPMVTAGGFAV